ncbi:MAG: putative lipoprotein [Myxococcaceae bacterium]|nr:putative lipoprotein [Myxococcaceae bacterium]
MRPLLLLPLVLLAAGARADDDEHDGEHHRRAPSRSPQLPLYEAECGACHLAFPPGLLPARSWQKLLANLDDHFGQNAELDLPARQQLERWLRENAAEAGTQRKSEKILRSIRGTTPLRISTLPYLLSKHDELPAEVFKRPSVSSRANCAACHPDALQGDFEEDRARIPR